MWQTPHATSRTSTSPAFGSASSTSWIASGAPNSSRTAALMRIGRLSSRPMAEIRPFTALALRRARPRGRRRAAVRRHLRRAARRVPRAQPVQRRPPDASRLRGAGRARPRRVARRRRARRGRRAGVLVARAATTSGRTASSARARASSPRCASSRTRTASSSRTSARMPGRRRGGCACCGRRARSSSRSSCSGTGRSRSTASASRTSRRRRAASTRGSGGSTAEFGDALTEELKDAQLLIADGHHRYETALAFHERGRHRGVARGCWS